MLRFSSLLLLAALIFHAADARVVKIPPPRTPLAWQGVRGHAPAAGALDDHPNLRINSDNTTQIQNEEMACMAPFDSSRFVAVWRDFRLGFRRVGVGYSTNAGQSWHDALLPAMYYPWQSDPILVVDAQGVFHAMVVTFDPATGGEDGLLQISSDDGGVTWHDSVWAANATVPIGFEDKEMLTVDVSPASPYFGTHYCSWSHFYGPTASDSIHLWLVYQRPGQAYSTPRILSQSQGVQWSNVCCGPDGDVYCSWVGFQQGGLMFSRSTDGGVSWSPEQFVVANFLTADIDPLLAIYGYGVMACDLTNGLHRGRLYMVYTDARPNFSETDIFFMYSDNHGVTWSNPLRIDDAPAAHPADQFHPWLSVDEEGRVWVVFYDRRNDPNNLLMDVYFTVSTDGGATWRANERITSVSCDPGAGQVLDAGLIGEYIGWQARGGKALCVWTDTRRGNQDAFGGLIDSIFTGSYTNSEFILQPSSLILSSFPNPTNSTAVLHYDVPRSLALRLVLYNTLGQRVHEEHLGVVTSGEHTYSLDLSGFASGIYISEIVGDRVNAKTKIVLLR